MNTERKLGLRAWQHLAIIALAVSFWLNGVLLIRFMSSQSLWGGLGSAIIFVLSIPIAAVSISGVRKLLRLSNDQLSPAIILIVALVAMLHGIGLTFMPAIYGETGTSLLFASAWLIWFCGAVLLPLFTKEMRG